MDGLYRYRNGAPEYRRKPSVKLPPFYRFAGDGFNPQQTDALPQPPRAKPTLHNATSPAHCHTSKGRLKKTVSRISDDPAAAKSVYFPYRNQGAES
ncbi:hypothetical protein [Neisseria sp. HMSC064E01]|uniref:hypothetical protein n=1 Tax=Neisseria sp. HMSC064E01 TaxID=1715052 RepID=UPI000A6A6B34|nr:hypothetical protein [Neisseria sp. HMSC064E01]